MKVSRPPRLSYFPGRHFPAEINPSVWSSNFFPAAFNKTQTWSKDSSPERLSKSWMHQCAIEADNIPKLYSSPINLTKLLDLDLIFFAESSVFSTGLSLSGLSSLRLSKSRWHLLTKIFLKLIGRPSTMTCVFCKLSQTRAKNADASWSKRRG